MYNAEGLTAELVHLVHRRGTAERPVDAVYCRSHINMPHAPRALTVLLHRLWERGVMKRRMVDGLFAYHIDDETVIKRYKSEFQHENDTVLFDISALKKVCEIAESWVRTGIMRPTIGWPGDVAAYARIKDEPTQATHL